MLTKRLWRATALRMTPLSKDGHSARTTDPGPQTTDPDTILAFAEPHDPRATESRKTGRRSRRRGARAPRVRNSCAPLPHAVWRNRHRCDHAGVLVFVEVKARLDAEFGTAAEAVTPRKQRRLTRMACEYLARELVVDRPCRFDVVTVMFDGPAPLIEVYVNAFDAC